MSFGPITLNITVVMGKDLKSMDYIGSSDPWVKLTLGGTVHNTTSKNNTLNPVWNETFKFNGSPNESLTIKVFDKDIITSDEIGGGTVPVTQLVEAAQLGSQLEVSIRNAKGEATGLIYLAVTAEGLHNIYGQSSQAAQQTAQAAAPLIVFLLNAQGLRPTDTIGASSDPWVQLELGGSVQKSKVQNNTTNPVWNEQFQFNAKGNDALNLKVYDKDTFMSDFVGEAAIPVQHLRQAELTGTVITVPLKDAKGTSSGTISIGAGAQAGRFGANPAAQGFGAFGGAGFGAAGLGGAGIGVNPNLAGGFGPGGVAGGFGGPLSGAGGAFGGPLAGGFGANAAFGGQGFGPAGFGPGAQGFGAGQGFGAAGFNQLGGLGVGPGTVGGFGAGVGPGFGAGGFGANAALGGFGAAGFGGAGFGNQAAGIVQLAIKVIGAQGLPAKDTWFTFGNHSGDPWVQLVLGGNTQRTKVVNNTLNPIWNEVFNFSVSSHDTLNIRIYDKDLVLSDFMAEGNVPAQTLLQGAQLGTQFPVQLQNPTGGSGGTIFLATAIVGGAGAGGNFGAGLGGFGAGGFGGAGFGTGFGAGGFGAGGFGQGFGAGFGGLGGLGGFGGAGFGGLGGLGGVDPSLLPPLIRRRIALARLLGVPIDPSILANLGNLGLGNAGDLIPYGGGAGFGGGFGAGFGGNAAALLGGLGGYGGGNIWRQRRNFGGARYLEDFEEPYGAYGGGLEYGYDNLYHGAAPIRQNYSHVEYDDAVAALDAADGVIDGCYFGRRILPQGASIGGGALRGPYPVAGGGRVLRERVLDPYPLY